LQPGQSGNPRIGNQRLRAERVNRLAQLIPSIRSCGPGLPQVRLWTSGKRRIAICLACRFDSGEEAFMGCIVSKPMARDKSRKTENSIGASHAVLGPVGCP
jgi:hypothetical protein